MAALVDAATQAAIRQGLQPCARADGEALSPALGEDEAVHATFRGVRLVLGGSGAAAAADAVGVGDLVVTTRRVAWLPTDPAAQALAVPFLAIDMHAVQGEAPDGGAGVGPCVYLQLSVEEEGGGGGGGGGANGAGAGGDASGGDDDDDDSASPSGGELRFVPADPADVDAIFAALCEGAALNPDPGAVGAEDGGDGDGELFFDREAAAAGAAAARLESLLVEDPARFEDPPEEE